MSKKEFGILAYAFFFACIANLWGFSWLYSVVPDWGKFPCFLTGVTFVVLSGLLSWAAASEATKKD